MNYRVTVFAVMNLRQSLLSAAAALLIVSSFVGCARGPIVPENLNPVPIENAVIELPSYAELVGRYNANASGLERVWARTKVEMRWRNEKGRARRESGDGRLIFERPLNTAWTVEVLGDPKLWAGSDTNGFWVFDLLDERRAFYGAYGKPLARPLPLPVQPEAVPYLLGLIPIDPDRRPAAPEVELFNGYFVIEPPGLNLRMLLDPDTARPVRIDLTDPAGGSVLTCVLTGSIEVTNEASDDVFLPKTAEVYPRGEGQESRMTVTFRSATTNEDKVKRKWFDFEGLSKALKPKTVVDLNKF
ncbi:MAG: hypothetical protein AAGH99_01530 [Planctomycetota bacterium]